MTETAPDPEEPFWHQIEEQPGNPLPRLIFADWCDENDRAGMATVQRWLAATGRFPAFVDGGSWYWVSEVAPIRDSVPLHCLLPRALFVEMVPTLHSAHSTPFDFEYANAREAEDAIEIGWPEATKRRWFGQTWRPDFRAINESTLPPMARDSSRETGDALSRQPILVRVVYWVLSPIVLALLPMIVSFIVLLNLKRNRRWRLLGFPFIATAVLLTLMCGWYVLTKLIPIFDGSKTRRRAESIPLPALVVTAIEFRNSHRN
jgi:uncharacterized protein (TIGR02996 family)